MAAPKTQTKVWKECPQCHATRFEKRVLYEIVNGEEVVVELEYRCYNHHTHTPDKLVDRPVPPSA